MRVDDPGCLNCSSVVGLRCPTVPCPGKSSPAVCTHLKILGDWRKLGTEEQAGKIGEPRRAIDPALRDAVNTCPSRGPVLPVSMQDDCGCQGREVSECGQGRGTIPGRVTLRDCLACRGW